MAARAKAIRLSTNKLAELAGVNKHTVTYVLNGRRDTLVSTAARLEDALIAEEKRVLAHLQKLHPQTERAPA